MIIRFYRWLMAEPTQPTCMNCDMLRSMLETERFEKKQLLDTVLSLSKPMSEPVTPIVKEEDFKPLGNKFVPWRVRQQMLEQEDRVKAQLIRDKKKELEDIERLEKELKLEEKVG